jgi:sulfite reductase alpha subunit-like flavoprotein/cytochrome b involved in lipid metabolism
METCFQLLTCHRERKAINELIYSNGPSMAEIKEMQNTKGVKSLDKLNVDDRDLLAVALGAPARQVLLRAEEIGPKTGWRDGYLSTEYGFCPPDTTEAPGALRNSPGKVWMDLCERMPGCVARGRVRESIGALPIVEGTADIIPDKALWAALVSLGMLCSIWRYEEKHDGNEGINVSTKALKLEGVPMCDDLGDEVLGIPLSIGLPYVQISIRMGRSIPHLTFFDQSSYNVDIKDPLSSYPYVGRFDNTTLRWGMFGDSAENAFLKGCADTAASFQHGVDAIAECQEHVMNRNNEGLLRSLVRLKEVLERMPNAFHTISPNDRSGENYVSPPEWVRWAKFSAPLSKRCPATSGLQFPPYLVMDAFLGRVKYDSFLGNEGVHLRAWLPSNLRAFIAAIEYHYQIPAYVKASNDPRLIGVLDGVVEAYTGERGFMGVHRYKVFGLLECAAKTGRVETNGNSGGTIDRSWEGVHKEFSESMKERLEPFRGNFDTQPHEMRGTFEECRYRCRILSRDFVDADPNRSIAQVTLDIENSGITFAPGDRLAVMPMNSWTECAKVAAALGLDSMLENPVSLDKPWSRFADHVGSITRMGRPQLTVIDILRKGHLAPLTKDLVMKLHSMLRASSNTVLQVLATDEWPVRGSLGDLLQSAVKDSSSRVWDQAFDISGNLSWLTDLIPVEVPRTYSISTYSDELLPSTVDLTISRSDYQLCSTFAGKSKITRHGVSSGFLNPPVDEEMDVLDDEELLIGVSRPSAFQLPFDETSPVALFAGGSGIAPFRSFWQSRAGRSFGKTILYLGVQSRERFAYENELRQYVNEGLMEVHTAFSRDSRGLVYDPYSRDLVEKEIPPRYIDGLIVEQGQAICDFVMSKKQGGIGGYIYVCGSVGVFDSVMSGIRKAIYNHRSNSMESADAVLNLAFAERRFMIDVFMTPKPLPCNQPTLPLSQLAMHTGHRPDSRLWIGVHGKVYDVTDFGAMHPGGMNIIKSNAGVDCSRSFDLLAHTNNPEVSSLLTKYYIGEMTPKPAFLHSEDLSMLYDLWAQYLRVAVETVVASHFEVGMIMESSNVWFQGDLLNMGGVRRFYHYQSRLLQGGFSSLFGAKLQELYLKISFTLANASSSTGPTRLPDVLGIIARAKGSADALTASNEISQIGQFTSNSDAARHHEKGIIAYAQKSVEFDMEFLEQIREEACAGMDAFDTIMELEAQSETQRIAALSTFLMQVLDRMANRLEGFYTKLARYSVFRPEMERNPARARWNILKRKVRDGSFFVLTQKASMTATAAMRTFDQRNPHQHQGVDFDMVVSQIQMNLDSSPLSVPRKMDLTEQHSARAEVMPNGVPAYEHYHNGTAIKAMSTFMDKNRKAIRRLSKLPQAINLEQLMQTYSAQPQAGGLPTPPSSRSSSRSPSTNSANRNQLSRRNTASDAHNPGRMHSRRNTATSDSSLPPTPVHVSPAAAMSAMMAKLNTRPKTGANSLPSPPQSARMVERTRSMQGFSGPRVGASTHNSSMSHGAGNIDMGGSLSRSRSNTGSLRSFRLQASAMAGGMNRRGDTLQE